MASVDLSFEGIPCTCDAPERLAATTVLSSMGFSHAPECALTVYFATLRRHLVQRNGRSERSGYTDGGGYTPIPTEPPRLFGWLRR